VSKQRRQMALNRERVRRCRESKADQGRVRREVYVNAELDGAIRRMAETGSTSVQAVMEDLLLVGLRLEEQVPAPFGFWRYAQRVVDRYR